MRFNLVEIRKMFPLLDIVEEKSYDETNNSYKLLVVAYDGSFTDFVITNSDLRRHV